MAGNGQTELLDALMGLDPLSSGEIEIAGQSFAASAIAVPAIRRCDVAYVPEDRMRRGLVADMPAQESIRLGREQARTTSSCLQLMQDWDVRPQDPQRLTRYFSGGNQQKLILARELEHPPKVLLIGQPTRGVDLAAAQLIHNRLRALRNGGCAILLVSTDLDELMSLCDRILVMHRGAITGIRRPAETNRHELGLLMAGQATRASA